MIQRLLALIRKVVLWVTRSDDSVARPPSSFDAGAGSDHDVNVSTLAEPVVSSGQRVSPPPASSIVGYADVVIGLDFGTSCSKVVIRTPFIGGGVAYSVPLVEAASGEYAFLCPTLLVKAGPDLALVTGGPCALSDTVEVSKLELMRADPDPDVIARTGLYLALLIKKARSWFLATHGGTLQQRAPRWSLNVGVPSRSLTNEPFHENFRRAGRVAWQLADGPHLSMASARETLNGLSLEAMPEPVDIVPEVIAEVMGYSLSQIRRPGLHLLVDVGAGTVDICGFLLHSRHDEDLYPILRSYVGPFGVHMLHRHRLKFCEAHNLSAGPDLDPSDPGSTIPSTLAEIIAQHVPLVPAAEAHERLFLDEIRKELIRLIGEIRKRRDPYSRAWEDGVPIFLAGGGGRHAFYLRLLMEADEVAQSYWDIGRFKVTMLPIPAELDWGRRSAEEFSRLAVAYGLGFTKDERGEIRPENDVGDVTRIRRGSDQDERYIGKEMV